MLSVSREPTILDKLVARVAKKDVARAVHEEELVGDILQAVKKYQLARHTELTKKGLDRARLHGVRIGRPPADRLTLIRAKSLVRKGRSVAGAAREAGVARSTLQRYMAEAKP
jgi:DNA invertase Pin-like site-specific DNA recombinase